jgi:MYXO-CTERM domain-containing protein
VVNAAADEAGGQGFVTEYADTTTTLGAAIWTPNDDAVWQNFQSGLSQSFDQMFMQAFYTYGGWDGFWDAVQDTVVLPDDIAFEDFQLCPNCYAGRFEFSPSAFVTALEEGVITPMRDMQTLFDDSGYVTRLYTTMSAGDMTLDPLFTFNDDLDTLSNRHVAERIIECNPDIEVSDAPWRIEFPQGGVIRGTAQDAITGTWPEATQDQPANIRITQQSDTGEGNVVEDNAETIFQALDAYNAELGLPGSGSGSGGSSSSSSTTTSSSGTGRTGSTGSDGPGANSSSDSGGCSISQAGNTARPLWFAASVLGLGLLAARRRRTRVRR